MAGSRTDAIDELMSRVPTPVTSRVKFRNARLQDGFYVEESDMQEVTVKKADLQKKVQENRAKHQQIFEEACEGYQAEAEKLLEQHLRRVREGKRRVVNVMIPVPVNQLKDYDRVLAMLEMSVADEITLNAHEFSQYVMDEWSWKGQFLTSNSTYSGTAQASIGGDF